MGKLVSWFFTKPSVEIRRQCSHFPAGESTSLASWLEVCPGCWRSALAGGLRAVSSGRPVPRPLLHRRIAFILGTPSPSSGAAFAVLVSGGWEPRERAKKAQGLHGWVPVRTLSPSPGLQGAPHRLAAPFRPACVVVLHPLVEEKVKEQLEAAKPEPIIEEVVSVLSPPGAHWGPVSAPSRCPMLLSSALSLLSLHFCVPFPPRSPWPSPPSRPCFPLSTSVPWGWAPPVLTCVCFLPRTWPTSRPESLTGERCHVGLAWTDWLLVPGTALWLGLSCPQSREMDSVDTQLHELTTACRTSWQDIKGA